MVALPLYRYCGPHCLFFFPSKAAKEYYHARPCVHSRLEKSSRVYGKTENSILREGKSQERMHYNNTQKKTVKRKVQISSDQIVACDTECGLSCNFSAKCVNT